MVSQDVSSFSILSCTSKKPAALLRDAPGSQGDRNSLCQYSSRHLLFCVFPFITRSPLWLLPSDDELCLAFNKSTVLHPGEWCFAGATGQLGKKGVLKMLKCHVFRIQLFLPPLFPFFLIPTLPIFSATGCRTLPEATQISLGKRSQ